MSIAVSDEDLPLFPSIVHALWDAERRAPDALALVCGERRLSFAELATHTRRLSAQLTERRVAGERVVILRPSSSEAVVGVLAAMAAGATAAPANPFFSLPELRAVLKEARPMVVLVGAEARDKVLELAAELAIPYVLENDLEGGLRELLPPRIEARRGQPHVGTDRVGNPTSDAPALLIFTGGTTGEPKAVVHTHRSLVASLQQHVDAWPLKRGSERFLSAAPIFHIWGLGYATFVPIYSRCAHFIISKYDAEVVLQALERERITVFAGGPAPIYMGLTQSPRFGSTDFSSLKYCLTGGSPCPEQLQQVWERGTGCVLLEGWGMSETGPLCLTPPNGPRPGSVGRPVKGTHVEAVDLDTGGHVLGTGEPGELRVRGPQLMVGYFDRPETTAEVLRDGWLYTGDIGYVDADGYVFLIDRKKDMIIVGGYNVYPRKVDEVLFKHPLIAEAATVGRRHERLGEELVAFVVKKPGALLGKEEFFEYCRVNLVKYRRPVDVLFLDALPRTNAKKLDKRALGALLSRRSAADGAPSTPASLSNQAPRANDTSAKVTVVSSKATEALLAELARGFMAHTGNPVSLEAAGGVDVANRVRAGAVFDVLVLADHVIDELLTSGLLVAGSKRQLVHSGVAVAVQSGTPHPDLGTEEAVRRAVLAARTIGHSTGPSGTEFAKLIERWGIADEVRGRIVVALPGVPVGVLVARGEVDLGFQQLSELIHVDGIEVVGPLPEAIQIVTTFSAAVGARAPEPELAHALVGFLASPLAADAKRRQGMEPS
jgi:long-chain acyl-CoA synthetase